MRLFLRGNLLLVLFLCMLQGTAQAQSGLTAHLSMPNSSAFPKIEAYLDVRDVAGAFVHNLQPDQVTVLESETPLPVETIQEQQPGVQVVFAINPGPAFAIRNFQAVSRYDLVKDALRVWANSRLGSTTDDVSLIITNGQGISHTPDHAKLVKSLDADQIDARQAAPSIDTLAQAVTLASDPTPRPGMGKTVLFVTSTVEEEIEQTVKDITLQAQQQDIRIEIWLVASPGALITNSTENLLTVATATGGQVFTFSGEETLPSPEVFLEPMRSIYRITYQSKIGLSGEHRLTAQVQVGEESALSNEISFQVDLQPPEPAFISPPISIERKLTAQSEEAKKAAQIDTGSQSNLLSPREVNLQVVFDFPDGRKRQITSSALIVDGVIVAEKKEPPYDQFIWNLDGYSASGEHQIQVQVTDELGMVGKSIQVEIPISVERPEADPLFVLRNNLVTISVLLFLFAGGVLFLFLIIGGRLHPRAQKASDLFKQPKLASKSALHHNEPAMHNLTGWVSRKQPLHSEAPDAIAYLQRFSDNESEGQIIPIASDRILFGSDLNQANLILDDPCIDRLHARLIHNPDGSFHLSDEGSIAGTWVNFTPVDRQGIKLENGDLVHFGRLGFRFTLRKPTHILRPAVSIQQAEVIDEMERQSSEGAGDAKEKEEPLL